MKRKGGATSSSSVRVHVRSSPIFWEGGGSSSFRIRVRVAGNCTVTQQVRQACMTQGGEQFVNSSRTQLVISSRTVEE